MTFTLNFASCIILAAVAVAGETSPTDGELAKTSALVQAKPESVDAWVHYGDALMQKGRETGDATYTNKAESAYRKTLAIDATRVDALVGMGAVAGVRREFESSIEWAQKALAVDSKNTAAYGLIGDAAVEIGDYKQAFAQYQKMLDLKADLSSYGRSARLLNLTGDSRRASFLMSKAIQAGSAFPGDTAWCRAQLALNFYSQGAFLPAQQVLEEGLRQMPTDYRLLAVMGKVAGAQKDYPRAIDAYRKSIAIAPRQDTVAALGDLYMLTGQADNARKQYAMVEKIAESDHANGLKGNMIMARFYADHDRNLEQALKLAEEEYRTRKNVYAADTLAWCYFKNGKIDEAKRTIELALSRNTPEAAFHYHKGMIFAAAGDRVEAQKELYAAMSINSNFDPLQTPLAMKLMQELGSAQAH